MTMQDKAFNFIVGWTLPANCEGVKDLKKHQIRIILCASSSLSTNASKVVACMKTLISMSIFFFQLASLARPMSPYTEKEKELVVRTGDMFTIQISRGEPIKIFVLGREEGKIDLKDLKVTVRRLKPYPAKDLPIRFENDYFSISDSSVKNPLEEIEVTAKKKINQGKVNEEKFKVDLTKP